MLTCCSGLRCIDFEIIATETDAARIGPFNFEIHADDPDKTAILIKM
jgi:hypothetical protein